MNSSSLVTVIMPAYNVASYIRGAIDSILNQKYQNLELLIYDDCSTDCTVEIIESYKDERIKLHKKDKNTGYTNSLIQGIKIAKGKYIARMDSDDISHESRLEKQVQFLESNTDYGIVGSFIETINMIGESQIWKYPVDDADIRLFTIINSPFAHPSIMIRKDVLKKNKLTYSTAYEPCEDYKLWVELLKVTKGANIDEVLLFYRLHENQTINLRKNNLIEKSNIIRKEVLVDLFNKRLSPEEVSIHYYFFNEITTNTSASIEEKYQWKKKLKSLFEDHKLYPKGRNFIEKYWVSNLRTLANFKLHNLKYLNLSVLNIFSFSEIIRFIIKCLIGYKVPEKK